ncbi:hypothetical protein BKA70DRAFT_1312727 [Coprinopsis sp. MPI-PUGE-AT-0042]|nr:hypothetical protein BKA70DRAFT_1312727 [Coprinopsis sp. MPI-PUGE-AT-0042]
MAALPAFPNEILDAVVDSAAEALSFTSPYGVTTTPTLVALLKSVALTSHHLRHRAQQHLFMNIRLYPFSRNSEIETEYQPSILDDFMSIFKDNPRLLQYPRLLAIAAGTKPETTAIEWGNWHFLTVVFPFFANNLRKLEHVYLLLDRGREWKSLPSMFQDAIINCLQGNELKSFSLKHLSLPRDFVHVLPSTLNACSIGVAVDDDPDFACKHIRTPNNGRQQTTASPTDLRLRESLQWAHKQEDAFFEQISYLHLGIGDLSVFESIMDRVPETLTHLTLEHYHGGYRLQSNLRDLHDQQMSFRHMPHLEELRVIVSRRDYWQIAFSSQLATLAADLVVNAYASIRIFRLVIKWRVHPSSLLREGEGSSERFLQRSPDGFARLDDQLSDERKFSSLEHVELSFEPRLTDTTPLLQEVARVHKDHLRKEAMDVFYKTFKRAKTLTVVTCNAFGCEA